MAILEKELIPITVVQNLIIDPNTAMPATGPLFFYVAGTTTPKNAYIYSGDPQNPFVAVTSLPLTGAGSPNVQLYMYPLDETDNKTPQLYRVAALNSLGMEVFVKDDFPFSTLGLTPSGVSSDVTFNLLPEYGFSTTLFQPIFKTDGVAVGTNFVSFGTFYNIETTNITSKNTIAFNHLQNSGIIGNPQNEITVACTGASVGDTLKEFGWQIGNYSSFQNKQLVFTIHIREAIGTFNNLNVFLIRENTVTNVPDKITIGSIPVTTTLTEQILTFTVPAVTEAHNNSDSLKLVLDFPNNIDFSVAMTATWLQESPDGFLHITEANRGFNSSKKLLQESQYLYLDNTSENSGGMPLALIKGGVSPDFDTGKIELFNTPISPAPPFPFERNRILMDGTTELLKDKIYGDTTTNRYLTMQKNSPNLRRTQFNFNTLISSNIIRISTFLGIDHLRAASAVAGGRITHTQILSEFDMGVRAILTSFGTNQLKNKLQFVWKDNGAVSTGVFGPTGVTTSYEENRTNVILANYMGVFTTQYFGGTTQVHEIDYWQPWHNFYEQQGTPTTQATYFFNFNTKNTFNALHIPQGAEGYQNRSDKSEGANEWFHYKSKETTFPTWPNNVPVTLNTGFLAWQDPATPLPNFGGFSMNGQYKYILGFDYNNDGGIALPTVAPGGTKRLVNIDPHATEQEVMFAIYEEVNNPRLDDFTYTALPQTNDYLLLDNGSTKFQVIYVEEGQPQPAPLVGETPIYVTFLSSDTIANVLLKTSDALLLAVGGVPDAYIMGLPLSVENLKYYIKI